MLSNFGPLPGTVFPDTEAVNVSAPAAGDGTEWIAAWANDHMGARQALMDYMGYTPNAVGEGVGASQFLDAIKAQNPAGTVVAWHGATDMSNFGRWIQLEGQAVLISDYPDLVAACYIGDGNNADALFKGYFKTSDAGGTTRNTGGPYFVLPDSRGYALRGYDPSGSVDPEGASREFPDYQFHAVQEHYHRVVDSTTGDFPGLQTHLLETGLVAKFFYGLEVSYDGVETESTIRGASSNPDETRMANLVCKFAIKY